jgi:hypothetical protein
MEPSGNRFEISPEPPGCVDQLMIVRQALAQHRSFSEQTLRIHSS